MGKSQTWNWYSTQAGNHTQLSTIYMTLDSLYRMMSYSAFIIDVQNPFNVEAIKYLLYFGTKLSSIPH